MATERSATPQAKALAPELDPGWTVSAAPGFVTSNEPEAWLDPLEPPASGTTAYGMRDDARPRGTREAGTRTSEARSPGTHESGAPTVGIRRRRPTPRQYRRRRVTALLAVVLIAAGGVGIIRGLASDDAATSAAPGVPDVATVSTSTVDTAAGDVVGESTPVSESSATPTTAGVPTIEHPVKLYIAGDSDAGTFAPYLERLMKPTKLVEITLDYTSSTGLARPDFYDWPAHLATKVPEVDPSIVVVTFGGNDSQGLTDISGTFVFSTPKGDPTADAAWRTEYGKRVAKVMDLLAAEGRTLIWVGIPNDNDAGVTAKLQVQDEVVREQVEAHPGVQFVDTWNRFSGRNGGWAEYVVDPRDGQGKAVRRDDGFHLNETGAEILALDIAEVIKNDLRTRGASI